VIGGWWGAPRPYYYPAYYPSYYPYYYTPAPVVVREVVREPLVYYDERGNPVPPSQPQSQAQNQGQNQAPGPQASAAAPTWFYCADSQTYYPYAHTCASPWQRVAPHPHAAIINQPKRRNCFAAPTVSFSDGCDGLVRRSPRRS